MSDQFICISCWKEFSAGDEEIQQRGGKVVCPFCGYVQPAPVTGDPPGGPMDIDGSTKLEDPESDLTGVAEEIAWSSVGDEEDIPVGEEERTDRVEVPPELLGQLIHGAAGEGASMADDMADEVTPVEPVAPLTNDDFLYGPQEPSSAVLLRGEDEESAEDVPTDWQLKTPSGLTFKFTDPEALLGWKKKLATYRELHVSPDGKRWVDFARFVREYEELGDPLKAFILSESLTDADLPPPAPLGEDEETSDEETKDDVVDEAEARSTNTAPQFTFKVKEEKDTGWGKYLLFAILGLGLGAAIVVAVLYMTGAF